MDVVAKGAVAVRSTPVFMLLFAVASEKYAANAVGCCCSVLHMLLTCAVAVVLFTIAVNALAVIAVAAGMMLQKWAPYVLYRG